jgi:hypothetical protein
MSAAEVNGDGDRFESIGSNGEILSITSVSRAREK